MARDRQLPRFLARVHPAHKVPVNATLVVAAVSLVLGLYFATREDGIAVLSTLVNFGAMTAFLVLHVSVVVHFVLRQRSRAWLRHLLFPAAGFAILTYVVIIAQLAAQRLGFAWLAVGLVVLTVFVLTGRTPRLAAEPAGERRPEPVHEE
jgi:amino acid transporter